MIECTCVIFASGYNSKIALVEYFKKNDKPNVPLPSMLISLSKFQPTSEQPYTYKKLWETKLLQAELARNGTISTTSIQLKKGWI